ncbi:MAG TPA: UDP-N-acetylglucosamine 1-carboxyvinyltransferase [Fastidiosipila sp.]|nr:UDP-N-acetylglucosamine 1-carboxyvinyltransferase [Fastidiosipila sp.]
MDHYVITGGTRLEGVVPISGSKNAALAIVAAAMVLDGPCRIDNLPEVRDINLLLEICQSIGATIEFEKPGTVFIDATTINTHEATEPIVSSLRGSYYLMGALLGRFGKAKTSMPGGCNFGNRPIDLHLKGFAALGASSDVTYGHVNLECSKLKGGSVFLDQVSVGATVNIMLAACKAEGLTVIDNAAREPHIVDLANFLNTMGADIRGAGTDVIRINGKATLPANKDYMIIPDQIEAGTYMMLAPLTRGDITVTNVIPKHMEPLTAKLLEMGSTVEEGEDSIRVIHDASTPLVGTSFKTMPYPGYPTDLQPQATCLLCFAEGGGRMIENVWENRYQFVDDLKKMGASILISGRLAVVQKAVLTGASVKANDLRAGAAMVMAGLMALGETRVFDIIRIERGYEKFIEKLKGIGAKIERESVLVP